MDRFDSDYYRSKFPDRQDEQPYYICNESKKPIYEGESYLLTTEGDVLRDDFNVVINHFNIIRKWAGEGDN